METLEVVIDGRKIGPEHPPYVIAELSGNHNGDIERAIELMVCAKDVGADAVKLQTYTPDTMTIDCDSALFLIKEGLWAGRKLHELYQEAQTPWKWHEALFQKARELGITIFSTPFDSTAVDFLAELGAPAFKIASFEATDTALIAAAARVGKPMIVSTGMANLAEISEAVSTIRDQNNAAIVLLHCVSAYPAPADDSNLRTISHLGETFSVVPGLSDHTLGTSASVAAVGLGACVIEKHVTLRRSDGGPDAAFSLEPSELQSLVEQVHEVWRAVGTVDYDRKPSESQMATFRRSVFVVEDVSEGEVFTAKNVRCIRPSYGLAPKHLPDVLGRRASRAIARGTPMDWSLVG
jgi:pseudaminic acid synthase